MVAEVRGFGDSSSESGTLLHQLMHLASLPGVVDPVTALPGARHGELSPEGVVFATNPDDGGVVVPSAMGDRLGGGVLAVKFTMPVTGQRILDKAVHPSTYNEPILGRPWQRRELMKVMHHGLEDVASIREGVPHLETIIAPPIVGADPGVLSEAARMAAERQLGMMSGVESVTVLRGSDDGEMILIVRGGQAMLPAELQRTARRVMSRAAARHSLKLPSPEVRCAPVHSHEGREYLAGMAAVMNFARANRTLIANRFLHFIANAHDLTHESMAPKLLGDFPTWSIRFEVHEVDGMRHRLCVHRLSAFACDSDSASDYPMRVRGDGDGRWITCQPICPGAAYHSLPAELSATSSADDELAASGIADAIRDFDTAAATRGS